MRRFGYTEEADEILASCVRLVERHGFREYYNPSTGEGLAARHVGWSTLLVDLLPGAGDPGAADKSTAAFVGSVPTELWSMGAEAATETRRRLGEGAAAARRRLRLRPVDR